MTRRERALELKREGLGYRRIARELGVGLSTAYYYLNPEKKRELDREWSKRREVRDRRREYERRYRSEHQELLREANRRYRLTHREVLRERARRHRLKRKSPWARLRMALGRFSPRRAG